jgi:hypothetical protein
MKNPNGGNQGESYENNDEYGYNQDALSFPPPDDKYAEFMRIEPPMFSSTTYPLEVDDWIKTIEEKLNMIKCNDREKALYASGQLIGAALEWWSSYINGHEQPESIIWKEFKDNFILHHTPVSAMKLKRKEFLDLKQGQMTETEYTDKFIQLSLYAPRSAESDKKKREHFIKGLNEGLQSILSLHDYSSLQDVINKAIGLESKLQQIISKKRIREYHGEANNNSHLHHMPQAQDFPEGQYKDAYLEYPHGVTVPVIYETPQNRRNIREGKACFYCKAGGHFINKCPKKFLDLHFKREWRQRHKQDKTPDT